MLLLDRVLECGPENVVTETRVGPRLPCFVEDRVPAYIGIEVMAQSIAVWSGIRRNRPGLKPPVGFLLGTRKFQCVESYFGIGSLLIVRSQKIWENEGLAIFSCLLDKSYQGQEYRNIATANISVYSKTENPGVMEQ